MLQSVSVTFLYVTTHINFSFGPKKFIQGGSPSLSRCWFFFFFLTAVSGCSKQTFYTSLLFCCCFVICRNWCALLVSPFLHNLLRQQSQKLLRQQSQKLTCFMWDGLLLLRSVSLVAPMVAPLVVHGSLCFSSSYLSGDMMWRFQKTIKKWNAFIVLQWRDLFTSRISWYYLFIFLLLPYMQHFTPEVIITRVNRKNKMARSPEGNHWAKILSQVSSLKNRS